MLRIYLYFLCPHHRAQCPLLAHYMLAYKVKKDQDCIPSLWIENCVLCIFCSCLPPPPPLFYLSTRSLLLAVFLVETETLDRNHFFLLGTLQVMNLATHLEDTTHIVMFILLAKQNEQHFKLDED